MEHSLTQKGKRKLQKAFKAVEEGVLIISRLHLEDSKTALSRSAFEELYIDNVLAPIFSSVSAEIKNKVAEITKKKQEKVEKIIKESEDLKCVNS